MTLLFSAFLVPLRHILNFYILFFNSAIYILIGTIKKYRITPVVRPYSHLKILRVL